jgi:hypothetical protein
MTAPDRRDVALIDRAERYGDELGPTGRWMWVLALVAAAAVLIATIVIVGAIKATGTFAPPPDDRPAVAYRSDEVRIPAVLKVHGHSALR